MWTNESVRSLRKSLEFTQEELAQRLGVSLGSVQAWEQNRKVPSRLASRELSRLAAKVSK